METEIYKLSIAEIGRAVRAGELTARMISESFLDRTEKIEPRVNAWVAYDRSYIESQAARIDEFPTLHPLTGVPVGIKDIFNTEFYPTAKGSIAWEGYKAGNDARCVSYLRQNRAIIFGKTDTAELAVHADGKAKNPHDFTKVTGSSSGGSAAAVATAMVPAALGSQTGGSTLRPASWCGVYAMKPSFGLIPRTGVLKTTDTLDTIGFFARSYYDLPLLLDVLRIHGDNFPIQEGHLRNFQEKTGHKWRIAFFRSPLENKTNDYVMGALEEFRKSLSSVGVEIRDIELPESAGSFQALHRRIYHPCLKYYLKAEFLKKPDSLSQTLREIFQDADTLPPEDYGKALEEQAALATEMEKVFSSSGADFFLTNSSNGSAPTAEPEFHSDLNQLWTMCWLPCLNIPVFKCPEGLPYGLDLVGPRFSDYKMFSFLCFLGERSLIPLKSQMALP